ncbi:hypothetical protein DQ04_23691000, partial [Trypanosoma grayi]|uniref:hypothetical protein n=1 Tax=Trypanosoma grayi TaxID=71804 RepID=UPI0004F40049
AVTKTRPTEMLFRCTRLRLSPRAFVPAAKLRTLLCSCGLQEVVTAHGDDFAAEVATRTAYQQFAPLFTPYFTLESQHLTMLGDTAIDEFLSRAILDYAMHAGLVLTVNATKQLNAVMHNHYALRLFAKELRFDELVVPLSMSNASGDGPAAEAAGLDFLEPQHVGLSGHDVAGTSFHDAPLRAGQSPLGWMFSHFVGAVQQVFGRDAARLLLSHTYGGLDANLPGCAAALLLRTLQHFPAANVTEAVLAAQGLPLRFVAKTRV